MTETTTKTKCDHPTGTYEERPWRSNDVLRCDSCGARWEEIPDPSGTITRDEIDVFGQRVTGRYRAVMLEGSDA